MYNSVYQLFNDSYGHKRIRRQHFSIGYFLDEKNTIDIVPCLKINDQGDVYLCDTYPQTSDRKRTNIFLHKEQLKNYSDVVKLLKTYGDLKEA